MLNKNIAGLGAFALGSRLKALLHTLDNGVKEAYDALDVQFEPRWFPVFYLLSDGQTKSITAIAKAIGQSHQAVNQVADSLVEAGLVENKRDKSDSRLRYLIISAKGKRALRVLEPVWAAILAAAEKLLAEASPAFLRNIEALESALKRQPYDKRIIANIKVTRK